MSTTVKILLAISCLLIGYLVGKRLTGSPVLNQFQDVFLKKILPIAVFCLIATLAIDLKLALLTVGIYNVITISFLVLTGFYFKKYRKDFNSSVLALGSTFINSIMVGIPLFELFGDEKLIEIIMLVIPIHSVSIFIAAPLFNSLTDPKYKFSWSVIKLPPITIALIIGVLFAVVTGGEFSRYTQLRTGISVAVQVLAYFTLGNMLSELNLKSLGFAPVQDMVFLKLLILPLLIFLLIFPFDRELASQLAVVASLPTGVNSLGYAANFTEPGNNKALSASILYTTAGSLVLTPTLYLLFRYMSP